MNLLRIYICTYFTLTIKSLNNALHNTVKAACIDSHMYRYIGSNDNFKYICWNFHIIHVTEYRVYRQSAVSTNRLY